MPIPRFLFVLVFGFLFHLPVIGQQVHDYHITKDLRSMWKIAAEDSTLVPYLAEPDVKTIYLELPSEGYSGHFLWLCFGEGHYLFINGKLFEYFSKHSCVRYDMDSLRLAWSDQEIQFAVYSEEPNFGGLTSCIVKPIQKKYNVSDSSNIAAQLRSVTRDNEFLVITILFLGLMLIIRTSRYKLFTEYFSVQRVFSLRQKSDVITSLSPFSGDHLMFEGLYAILISFAVVYPGEHFGVFSDFGFSDWDRIGKFIILSIAAFFAMKLKLFLINTVASLFRIRQLITVHYFTYFRLSLLIAILSFGYSILIQPFFGDDTNAISQSLAIVISTLLLVRLVTVALVLNNKHTFRKLHLFFYLCTTELFPLVIFIKVFLK